MPCSLKVCSQCMECTSCHPPSHGIHLGSCRRKTLRACLIYKNVNRDGKWTPESVQPLQQRSYVYLIDHTPAKLLGGRLSQPPFCQPGLVLRHYQHYLDRQSPQRTLPVLSTQHHHHHHQPLMARIPRRVQRHQIPNPHNPTRLSIMGPRTSMPEAP